VYEATECAIHLNAYYLNLCGALDNLAWVLQYEWQLLADVKEDGKRRHECRLRGAEFRTALKSKHSELVSVLDQHDNWIKELANLRDPAAHRVPIYVPPAIATSQEQVGEFHRIMAQAEVSPVDRLIEIRLEAQAAIDFVPCMVLSTPQGWVLRPIHAQVRSDHDKYLTIASAVVEEL